MPAKDKYHDHVRAALEADGWTITHDPFRLDYGDRILQADLGAVRGDQKVVVEIKTFHGDSGVKDLHGLVGQHSVYQAVLTEKRLGYILYMAVPHDTDILEEPLGQLMLRRNQINTIGYNVVTEDLVWTTR